MYKLLAALLFTVAYCISVSLSIYGNRYGWNNALFMNKIIFMAVYSYASYQFWLGKE